MTNFMSQKEPVQTIVYLSLGSNMGDRMGFLQASEKLLIEKGIRIINKSQIYETEPWTDGLKESPTAEEGQMWFLNEVIKAETALNPYDLLRATQDIEKKLGRTKKHHWGPREIDIDILLFGNSVIDTPELIIPHRHMYDRQFVLVPLLEIEPDLSDPVSRRPLSYFLKNLKDRHKVRAYF